MTGVISTELFVHAASVNKGFFALSQFLKIPVRGLFVERTVLPYDW